MEESVKKPRRRFDEQFKRDAVGLLSEKGRTLSQVARDLGIGVSLLRKWQEKFAANGASRAKSKGSVKSAEEIENEKLRRELARVTEEREILKKALAVFSRRSG